jgi:hypothetical protein
LADDSLEESRVETSVLQRCMDQSSFGQVAGNAGVFGDAFDEVTEEPVFLEGEP